MTIAAGTALGSYEVVSLLGAGGMGEVYRARDIRLGRSVAIKVLPEALASDVERIARLEREAKVLASLNHPHIAALYGLESTEGQPFLIMELVEGETLADRLARGPLKADEALRIAVEIARALEAAHEQGIVHRDLKPANIKLTPDDTVKVLDFGLARAMDAAPAAAANVTHSPTLSLVATQAGMILGTAAYMSPEQASGLPADHRSDVFSFGCVVYEMLTGRQAFKGENAAEILASVLVRDPDLDLLPSSIHPRLPDVLRRCFQKKAKDRWHAIADLRAELETIAATPAVRAVSDTTGGRRLSWKRAIPLTASALVGAALTAAAYMLTSAAPSPTVTRFRIPVPTGQAFSGAGRNVVAVSPDGTRLAYVANRSLYIRSMSEFEAKLVPGTELNPSNPVFSPDGMSLVFRAGDDSTLKRISVTGGAPVTISGATNVVGVSWSGDTLLFGTGSDIMRLPERGGTTQSLVKAPEGTEVAFPQLLPDRDTVLLTVQTGGGTDDTARKIVAHSLSTGRQSILVEGGSHGQYVQTGHLVYALGGVLLAAPFDLGRLELTGGPVPVVEGVRRGGISAWYSVSSSGALVYVPGPIGVTGGGRQLALANRNGNLEPLDLPTAGYQTVRVSPDGRQLAIGIAEGADAAVWVYSLGSGAAMRRLTFEGQNRHPIWSPDGRRVAFQATRGAESGIYWQLADGTAAAEKLTTAEAGSTHVPESWSPDGRVLLFSVFREKVHSLWTLSLTDRSIARFGNVQSTGAINATFSPDGRWVAYGSTELGRVQVFIQPFPATGSKYQISREPNDGHHPVWSRTGDELFMVPAPARFGSVKISTRPTLSFGEVESTGQLFTGGGNGPAEIRGWDITPSGTFVGLVPPGSAGDVSTGVAQPGVHVILHWFEELKARVPVN